MKTEILVTYVTNTGSTTGVAAVIQERLVERGFSVDLKPVGSDVNPQDYQAVILGSAVNGANWLPQAVQFVQQKADQLNQMPVYVFSVHIMNTGEKKQQVKRRLAYLKEIRSLFTPEEEAYFPGMGMDPETASRFERWLYRTFKIGPEGDNRDWEKIRAWADHLGDVLEWKMKKEV